MSIEPPATFNVRIDRTDGGAVVVAAGELDLAGAERLAEALPDDMPGRVVLDLEGVTFLDSSGLRSLLEIRQRCEAHGITCELARPSTAVMKVIELASLGDAFTITGSR